MIKKRNSKTRDASQWQSLQHELAEALASMGDGQRQFLVLSDRGMMRYVQFAVQSESDLRAEAVSNHFLPKESVLSENEIRALVELGWMAPDAESSSEEPTGQNYFRNYQRPIDYDEVAGLAVRTMRDVFQIPFPGRMEYEAFEKGGGAILLPTLQLVRRRPRPTREEPLVAESIDSIRGKLLTALRAASGNQELEPDKDKDISVRFGSAAVFVRAHEDPPHVSVFSPMLSKVEVNEELLRRLNDLNSKIRFARLFEIDKTIFAAVELSTVPFIVEHVVGACRGLGELADSMDEKLQSQFGGRTAFGEYSPKSADAGDAERGRFL